MNNTFTEDVREKGKKFFESNKDRTSLLEHEVKDFIKGIGLPVPEGVFVRRGGQIPSPLKLGFPVVAKVSSEKITSKSDVHGVQTGIRNDSELKDALGRLEKIEHAEGVLIEEMAGPGVEVITGGIVDIQFGPLVMFGTGGIFVEIFRDVAFALAPVSAENALKLIKEVKGYRILQAYRGRPAVDINSLVRIIMAVSELISTGYFHEIDLNPVALYQDRALVLDAKLSIKR